MISVSWQWFDALCDLLSSHIKDDQIKKIYGIPTGGSFVAVNLAKKLGLKLLDSLDVGYVENFDPEMIIVDDIVDSGKTISNQIYQGRKKYSLFVREGRENLVDGFVRMAKKGEWVLFPYERKDSPGEEIVTRLIQYIGDDPNREGLRDTPKRVIEFLSKFTNKKGDWNFTSFKNEEKYDQMIVVSDLDFYSLCEHHLLPFFGKAHIGYLPKPDGKILGLSKFSRVVEEFSHRLQLQERMTQQIADFLEENLDCLGLGVIVEAVHLCMSMRGVKSIHHKTITSAMKGVFLDNTHQSREEFLRICLKGGRNET